MYNDSLETLLLRHYGSNASTPPMLEQRIVSSVRHQTEDLRQQERMTTRLREQRISRRRAVQLVAISSAGLGLLTATIASVQSLDAGWRGQDITQPSLS